MICYYPLWDYLKGRCMSRVSLLNCISSPTLAKLGKNEIVDISTIDKICSYLNCQPSDIMHWYPD